MLPMPPDVRAAFEAFPPEVRHRLAEIRAIILDVAAGDDRIGAITERLKWGEPAYLTAETGSGSTVRLGRPRGRPDCAAVYFICHTPLVEAFRARFGALFEYEANRAVLLPVSGEVALVPLEMMLSAALTYHLRQPGG
ncbi:MAG: DUF1801 domain-containing protein [Alphaproteobacteria bacterium]|nr:MAG: DUF1801 domain-containing protein [Alphaproteobacteria bacterium]